MNIAEAIINLCNDKLTTCNYLTFESVLDQELANLGYTLSDVKEAAEADCAEDDAWQKEICRSFLLIRQGILNAKDMLLRMCELANVMVDSLSSEKNLNDFIDQIADEAYNTDPKVYSYSKSKARAEIDRMFREQYMSSIDAPKVQSILRAIKSSYEDLVNEGTFVPRGYVERGVFEYVDEADLDYLLPSTNGEFSLQDVENYAPTIKNEHIDEYVSALVKMFAYMHISDESIYSSHSSPEGAAARYITFAAFRPSTEPSEKRYTYDVFPGEKIYSTKSSTSSISYDTSEVSDDSNTDVMPESHPTSSGSYGTAAGKYENIPWIGKLILQLLFGTIVSFVYRIMCYSDTKEKTPLIGAILTIIPPFCMLILFVDLLTVLFANRIVIFTK